MFNDMLRRRRPTTTKRRSSEVQKKSEDQVYADAQARANQRAGFTGTITGGDQLQTGGGIFSGIGGSFRQSPSKLLGTTTRKHSKQIFDSGYDEAEDDTDGSTCRHINVTWSEIQNGVKITTLTGRCMDCDEEVKSKINPNDIPRPKMTGKELEKQKEKEKERKIVESMWIRHKDYEKKYT